MNLLLNALPVLAVCAFIEGVWLQRQHPNGYDWKESFASFGVALGQPLFNVLSRGLAGFGGVCDGVGIPPVYRTVGYRLGRGFVSAWHGIRVLLGTSGGAYRALVLGIASRAPFAESHGARQCVSLGLDGEYQRHVLVFCATGLARVCPAGRSAHVCGEFVVPVLVTHRIGAAFGLV